ncbi:MAG TPA: 3-oxoacyl-[acyl-carrier-protein] synthase III C-terminal domain-containing protein, partial [Flavipsychrobacter sp.]|nr:3-oxoacyl-[acyl-carrier-protein] synthase III C-terminal domain-containing protein [Flavipsychrobacter sp.]
APATSHTAINFMGCYAAIHGLKQASDIIQSQPGANVLVVCTELCTLHFQKTFDEESISAPLLFSDGSAAVLVTGNDSPHNGLRLDSFYSEVLKEAKDAMSWNLSSNGFIMTLSAEVPELFKHDIVPLKQRAIARAGYEPDSIKHWCIHPGGKRILEAICAGLQLEKEDVCYSYEILKRYGNMSSPTILFVLKEMWKKLMSDEGSHIFGAAFGPGLTMESMIMTVA